jgi:Berberine and berberine like
MVLDEPMYHANQAQLAKIAEAFGPYENGRRYLNFTERPTDPARFYPPAVYRRLREVKAAVDPGDVFRSNHPIPAA